MTKSSADLREKRKGNVTFTYPNFFPQILIQLNLYKMISLGTTQKWSSWAVVRLIKHLWQVFSFFPTVLFV